MGALDYLSNICSMTDTKRALKRKKRKPLQIVELKVKMDCDGCERRVKHAANSMRGSKYFDSVTEGPSSVAAAIAEGLLNPVTMEAFDHFPTAEKYFDSVTVPMLDCLQSDEFQMLSTDESQAVSTQNCITIFQAHPRSNRKKASSEACEHCNMQLISSFASLPLLLLCLHDEFRNSLSYGSLQWLCYLSSTNDWTGISSSFKDWIALVVHSSHVYFIVAGDINSPIIYQVRRVRDGKSFVTRRVDAKQHGLVIFALLASFQKEESGFDHQVALMPEVPAPEMLPSMEELREGRLTDPRLPMEAVLTDLKTGESGFGIMLSGVCS